MRLWSATGLAMAGLAGVATWGGSARAAAPETLAVFNATATASPYGVVSRVPAETSGGVLYSGTSVDLGKSRAIAAGFTAGELGDLFIVSSAPPGTITDVPTVIRAQEPPQEKAPLEAEFAGGRSGSAETGEARNFTLAAEAAETPSATATADGQAVRSTFYTSGFSTSSSDSRVQPDGTVVAKAVTTVQDIVLGPVGAQLSVASASSTATVTIPIGQEPVTVLQTRIYGAQLAGVPVTFDENGITIDQSVAVPASAIAAFDAALDAFAAQGLIFRPVQRTETVTDGGAAVSGAAFVFRYRAPDAIPRPSDIGSDQTFAIASVTAAATSRARSTLGGPPVAGATPGAVTSGEGASLPAGEVPAAPGPGPDLAGLSPSVGLPGGVPGSVPDGVGSGTAPVASAPTSPTNTAFFLPARVADPLPDQVRDSYTWILIAAALGLTGLFVLLRQRPT